MAPTRSGPGSCWYEWNRKIDSTEDSSWQAETKLREICRECLLRINIVNIGITGNVNEKVMLTNLTRSSRSLSLLLVKID